MKPTLLAFARDVDAFCRRLNSGLAAVAIVLGVVTAALGVVRAEQYLPTALDNMMSVTQLTPEP